MLLRKDSSARPRCLSIPFCERPRDVRIVRSFSARYAGLGRRTIPIRISLPMGFLLFFYVYRWNDFVLAKHHMMISPGVYFYLTPWRHSSLLMSSRFTHRLSKEMV